MGVIIYIFKDSEVVKLLKAIHSDVLILRAPCSEEESDIYVDTYSEELDARYASRYRTHAHVRKLVEQVFTIEDMDRIYPDHLESKYGTKQYILKAVSK